MKTMKNDRVIVFAASLLLHALGAAAAWHAGFLPPKASPPVVDLTLGDDPGDGNIASSAPSPSGEGRRSAANARRESSPAPETVPSPAGPTQAPAPEARPLPAAEPAPPASPAPDPSNARFADVPAPVPPAPSGEADRAASVTGPGGLPGAAGGLAVPAPAAAGSAHGAPAGATVSRATPGTGAGTEEPGEARAKAGGRYLERHYAYIRDAIQQGISYPPMARRMGWEGKVVVAFLVLSDGSVRDVRVVRGSGHPALDRGAVEAVRKAAPFPRPPAEAEIITPVVYRLD